MYYIGDVCCRNWTTAMIAKKKVKSVSELRRASWTIVQTQLDGIFIQIICNRIQTSDTSSQGTDARIERV